ncbi:unnamed protein product [Tuber melanosporum]|uniref:(Perigord truffle) hypothetical protein n=1 Tax=Tuber melanosporum (strain Mel28) TaxID=656061 RepID=D5G4R3_TUBMM|nr:uncharacterized protein GSTUM_00000063001 [Tuber melanosporum]CAZ79499.1 unnamed protein product [Tuber melanosporum]
MTRVGAFGYYYDSCYDHGGCGWLVDLWDYYLLWHVFYRGGGGGGFGILLFFFRLCVPSAHLSIVFRVILLPLEWRVNGNCARIRTGF